MCPPVESSKKSGRDDASRGNPKWRVAGDKSQDRRQLPKHDDCKFPKDHPLGRGWVCPECGQQWRPANDPPSADDKDVRWWRS